MPSGKFSTFTMAISAGTNTLFGRGDNSYGQLGLGNNTTAYTFTALTGNWSNVFVGGNHTMALSAGTSNKWFSTGDNGNGQLGLGTRQLLAWTPKAAFPIPKSLNRLALRVL